ncbi:MAG TPA: NADH-quinone oxidoreductase subunit NuoF [Polyangiaceae bacterium]|nr:NADH-quinone oxidoreductase subunit NuoF [Polyangiaceae bacterium]
MTDSIRTQVLICTGGGCIASGALQVSAAVRESLRKRGLSDEVQVIETGCLGPCSVGPVAVVYPDEVFYEGVKPEDADFVVEEHLLKGRPVERLVRKAAKTNAPERALGDVSFFKKQIKVALRNCGIVDPLKIEEYIARDGYEALSKVLTTMTPDQVIEEAKKSGLRGRGGAGFSTGMKWALTRKSPGDVKFILCNADEGDPGAFMDRSVLEGDPHTIIEGMAIGGYAIGASQGYVYVRAEYPLAVERLGKALEQAREYGLLGKNILGSGFDFDLEIRMGAGAFVCGEETALMTSIEGKRGEPRPRPPFPAVKGLWGKPSCLNNVETFANIPSIMLKGAEWFASMGTEKSKGTKVFALAGSVNNTGLVEVPIGMPLGEIIYDIGGGLPPGKRFKAAQMGGPSGGCIPRQHLNVPVDYESLNELGAIMGSGGLVVMDEDSCMVDVARFFLEFVQEESCGKCTPCRVGTKRMLEIVTRICKGKGEPGDIERLEELGKIIRDTALCGLGQTAPNPVLSTIRHFRHEYVAHIRDKRCEAGVCADLVRAPCNNACPCGVNVPGYISLIGEERYSEALKLHRERNPLAAICSRVCFHPCENKCRRAGLDNAVSIRSLKRFLTEQEETPQLPEVKDVPANAKRKVAVVGAGPAGLSCAYFLARMGYKPVVFEASTKAGGLLVQGIPAYRLPRDIVEREVRMIERMGVTFQFGKRLGTDFTLADLKKQGFESVFLGIGAPHGWTLDIPGDKSVGVVDSMKFLRDYNDTGKAEVGKKVVVIGGGNAAIDAARTAVRLGSESVTILYRRTRDEMPAWEEEVEEAEREGVRIKFLVAPVEVLAKDGKVAGVKCNQMALGPYDKSGRRRPVKSGQPDFVQEADMVISAIGQSLDAQAIGGSDVTLKRTSSEFVETDPRTGQTSVEWVFAGGDAAAGPSSVTESAAFGERAAAGMDKFLTGEDHAFWRTYQDVDTFFDPDADPNMVPRANVRMVPVEKRRHSFVEVETSWSKSEALREATRCLRCDYRGNC